MMDLDELSDLAILAFKNGIRLHFDSILLFKNCSFPSSVLLSVLSMEEFGKYFSLSSYVFYSSDKDTRDEEFEKKFLDKLYSHPFKQRAVFGRDGFFPSQKDYNEAQNRFYENLKQRSLYVGYERGRGSIFTDQGINNPFEITEDIASEQVNFVNSSILKMADEKMKGFIEMDEPEVNEVLNEDLINKLKDILS